MPAQLFFFRIFPSVTSFLSFSIHVKHKHKTQKNKERRKGQILNSAEKEHNMRKARRKAKQSKENNERETKKNFCRQQRREREEAVLGRFRTTVTVQVQKKFSAFFESFVLTFFNCEQWRAKRSIRHFVHSRFARFAADLSSFLFIFPSSFLVFRQQNESEQNVLSLVALLFSLCLVFPVFGMYRYSRSTLAWNEERFNWLLNPSLGYLALCSAVSWLDLSSNDLGFCTSEQITVLAFCLSSFLRLQHLSLAHNDFYDYQMSVLLPSLANLALCFLDLSGNRVSDRGSREAFKHSCERSHHLHSLFAN